MNQSKVLPRISFKGVLVFMVILFMGIMLFPLALRYTHLSETMTYFLSAGVSASIGISVVLIKIDGNPKEKTFFRKRILISIIVGFVTSALMTFVFGGDILD